MKTTDETAAPACSWSKRNSEKRGTSLGISPPSSRANTACEVVISSTVSVATATPSCSQLTALAAKSSTAWRAPWVSGNLTPCTYSPLGPCATSSDASDAAARSELVRATWADAGLDMCSSYSWNETSSGVEPYSSEWK